MLLLAIDLYGIEPFQKPTRIPVKPGLNIISGPNGAGKTAVCRVLAILLLNRPVKGLSFVENQPAQAAVIFQSRDGGTYRIAADFLKEIFQLSKLDPAGKGTLIERERGKIAGWIRKEVDGIGEDALSSLFMIDRSRLPSASSSRQIKALGPLSDSMIPATSPSPISSNRRAKIEKELEELKKKLDETTQIEDETLLYRDQASEIRRRIDQYHDLERQLNQLQELEIKKFSALKEVEIEKVPTDLLRRYEEGDEARHKERLVMEEEKMEIDAALARFIEVSPFRDQSLIGGVGITLISFVLPQFITLQGPLRHLILFGVLGGIGLAAFSYFKVHQKNGLREVLEKKSAGLVKKLDQIDRKFEKEFKDVVELMKKTGVKEIQELKELQRSYQNHLQRKQRIRDKREADLKGETLETLERKGQECEEKAQALHQKIKGSEGLHQEVYRLQEELRTSVEESSRQGAAQDVLEMSLGAPVDFNGASPAASFVLTARSTGSQAGVDLPFDEIRKEAAGLSLLFTPAKKGEIRLDETGAITFGNADLDHLSSGHADQLFLSVAVSIWDRFKAFSFPLVLDEPFIHFDLKRREVVLELLKGTSKSRQILLFTVYPYPPNTAANRVQLPGP